MGWKKFFVLLNNEIFPASYSLWKESQDKIYNQIKEDLRPSWLSTQHTIYSSMSLPIIFLGSSFLLTLAFKFLGTSAKFASFAYFFFIFAVLFFIVSSLLFIRCYDKYTDQKYLELSKTKIKQ